MKKLFITFTSAFGSIPGLLVLRYELGAPPGQGRLFGALMEAVGVLSLLAIWINRQRVARAARRRVTKWAATLVGASLLCVALYFVAYKICVVSDPYRGTVFFPLVLSGELADRVDKAGGRYGAIDKFGRDAVFKATQEYPVALGLTTALLLILYLSFVACLTIAFGLVAAEATPQRHRRPFFCRL